MTSTSKTGLVVITDVYLIDRTGVERVSEPMREQSPAWRLVLQWGAQAGVMLGVGSFVCWALMKLALYWMGK